MDIPSDLTHRPLQLDDARGVFEVMAAQERTDLGEVLIEEADIVGDWSRPVFDVASSTVGVFDGDRLVAYGEVGTGGRGDAAVDPAYRGRGLGTAIALWMQDNARSKGVPEIGMPVPAGSPGDRLLDALGYRVRWESWGLELPAGATVPARELPEGYVVRERETYDDWLAQITGRPGFEPWNLRVVVDPAGRVVSFGWVQLSEDGTTAFIARLATTGDERGRGLAQALLVDAFAVGRAHGAIRSELSTDSRTGALGLYEKVGMRVTSTWVNRAIAL